MNGGLLSAWMAELILITYRGSLRGSTASNPIPHLPVPAEYGSTFIIYGALAFIPESGQRFASLVGWGLVAATFLNLWNPGKLAAPTPGTGSPGPTSSKAKAAAKAPTEVTGPATSKTPTPGFSPTPYR
jgi:hypothetical protein